MAGQVYVLSVPDETLGVPDDGWVFPTATHPLILDLANHVAPGKVDGRQGIMCAPDPLPSLPRTCRAASSGVRKVSTLSGKGLETMLQAMLFCPAVLLHRHTPAVAWPFRCRD